MNQFLLKIDGIFLTPLSVDSKEVNILDEDVLILHTFLQQYVCYPTSFSMYLMLVY